MYIKKFIQGKFLLFFNKYFYFSYKIKKDELNNIEKYRTGLKILNSLSGKKDEFIPLNKNIVNWYICGPTVYDDSHMGHARNYVAFDIIRRIMETYFRYDVRVLLFN